MQNHEPTSLEKKLKATLMSFQENNRSLEFAFESASKHIPVYLKIVKGHIEQLTQVLSLESHQSRQLSDVGLAEPVKQLISLFSQLQPQDLDLIESLALNAANWRAAATETSATEQKLTTPSEI